MQCGLCHGKPAIIGILCCDCGERLQGRREAAPDSIASSVEAPLANALVDRWGRVHRLGEATLVGRRLSANTVAILTPEISREHAQLWRADTGWMIRDLKSANGTSVNGLYLQPERVVVLSHGDVIGFAGTYVYYAESLGEFIGVMHDASAETVPAINCEKLRPGPTYPANLFDEETGRHVLPTKPPSLHLIEPEGGGGGVVQWGEHELQLGEAQYTLMCELLNRRLRDESKPEVVRGFVQSAELLDILPWDTPHPSEDHLKQLVRRTRNTLSRAGLGDVIESRRRFGYRLRPGATVRKV